MPKNKKTLLYGDSEEETPLDLSEAADESQPFSLPKAEYKVRLVTPKLIVLVDSYGNGRSLHMEEKYKNLKQGDTLLLASE